MTSEEKKVYNRAYNLAHLEEIKASKRAYYVAHREEEKAYKRAYRLAHREDRKAYDRAWYLAHREDQIASARAYGLAHRQEHKASSIRHHNAMVAEAQRVLGNKCACPGCEVYEPAFLTIDHVNGRSKGLRRSAVVDARASGWDKTKFQILCANCNFAKRDRGFCPVHQADPRQRNGHSPDLGNMAR